MPINSAPAISHNIPQSAIDEMMREEEEIKTLTNNDHVMSEDKISEKPKDLLPPMELPLIEEEPS